MVVHGQVKLYPVIKDYGAVFDVPFAKDKPDTSVVYKIIIEAGPNFEKPEELYAPLENISLMYNLHVYSGIPQKNLYVELVIFGQRSLLFWIMMPLKENSVWTIPILKL